MAIKFPVMVSYKRASCVIDVIDAWLEEMEQATQDVEKDRSNDTPELLLEAIDGMHSMYAELSEFRAQLGAISVGHAC